jgi:hypothetical protein
MKISKEQQSIIAIAAGLLVIAWARHSYIFLISGFAATIAFPFAVLNVPIHNSWMLLSKILGWISSHIILSILFYLFLTPISLLRKLMGRQDMKLLAKGKNSVFYQRNHVYNSKDFLNPW